MRSFRLVDVFMITQGVHLHHEQRQQPLQPRNKSSDYKSHFRRTILQSNNPNAGGEHLLGVGSVAMILRLTRLVTRLGCWDPMVRAANYICILNFRPQHKFPFTTF